MNHDFLVVSGESSGMSSGAKAGIAIAVLMVLGFCAASVAWWFYRKRKGKLMFEHQEFDNPVYFSTNKQELYSDNGAIGSDGTGKGT